ncbi:BT4734/BF3469 family protein [Daejeonella lutea]|uniref:VirE N-terminal domain-containing protein n=1 Tax=Daejeonella lutea TaxID=572036 RepID=A0A1T4ZWJ8_9SPHI|nr:BT4734/BF3469 family protein [Daejeonella lutea]SKB27088.1 VirE N-terminal domain-containing protein [Daejeonella lutea]
MIKDFKVGYYPKPFKHEFKTIDLEAMLKSFRGDFFKPQIEKARQLYLDQEFEKYTLLKNTLPAVTFSGTFSPTRTAGNLITYSSLIILDVDKAGEDLNSIKELLSKDQYILAVWLSPSGDGLKSLIVSENAEDQHKKAYRAATIYYKENYNITIDTSGSDVSRLCFISYDPNIKVNVDYKTFNQLHLVDEKVEILNKVKKVFSRYPLLLKDSLPNDELSKLTYKKMYHFLSKRGLSITESYENWVRVAFALSNTFNLRLGSQYFLELCRLDGVNHDEYQSEKLIHSCYQKGTSQSSFATLLYLAKEKGFDIHFNKKMNVKKKAKK